MFNRTIQLLQDEYDRYSEKVNALREKGYYGKETLNYYDGKMSGIKMALMLMEEI
jgi:hypothetical protein